MPSCRMMSRMKLVALSGGIASGKSTIAKRLSELGAVHLDADQFAQDAVMPGSTGLSKITEHFGTQILTAEGALDRGALGEIVFANAKELAALNSIVHPEVRHLVDARLREIEALHPDAVVIYDVPLLVEAGVEMDWDLVVIAEAPESVRMQRLINIRGMSGDEAAKRIANQASDDERRAIADVVIDTGGSMEHTIEQTDALWRRLNQLGKH